MPSVWLQEVKKQVVFTHLWYFSYYTIYKEPPLLKLESPARWPHPLEWIWSEDDLKQRQNIFQFLQFFNIYHNFQSNIHDN